MTSKKLNHGQQWMPGVQQAVERSFEDRPRGMPTLAMIKIETIKLGLPDSDADHLYDIWLRDDFKTVRGTKIRNWHAAIRIWFRSGWFPSQKKAAKQPSHDDQQATQLAKFRRLKNG
jgi:hypothetical protein